MTPVDAGLDVGATHVRAAVSRGDDVAGHARRSTPTGDAETLLATVRTVLADACEQAGVSVADIDRTGIGSLGPLDLDAGAIVDPPNLPGVDRVPLVAAVEDATGGAVRLFNDGTAGALGAAAAAPDPPENLVYVTISTGLGAGALVDGHLLVGERGNAAEVGHLTLDPDSALRCGCGGTGHWEAFCSGANVPDFARHLADETGLGTDLALSDLTAREVFDAAGEDPLATRTVAEIGRYNALGVAAVVHAYDPADVVLGGGVAVPNPDAICAPIRERLPELVVGEAPPVRVTDLGDEVVVRGALAGARRAAASGD
ncbi:MULTISPECIES: ROK family protein [Salinibaculum]|uniref:ROK family protein n=1 Tax=Salinibaculum TaxID=2732368 RepID=UPI0030CC86A6